MSTKLKSQLAAARTAVADAAGAIDRLRGEIARLRSEREAVAGSPLPLADALGALRAHLDYLATASRPDLDAIAVACANGTPRSARLAPQHDPLQLPAVLARPLVEEALIVAVQRFYEDRALVGMSPAARDKKLRELDDAIARLELEEEQTIEEAEALGMNIPRRIDCDPGIVLGLRE